MRIEFISSTFRGCGDIVVNDLKWGTYSTCGRELHVSVLDPKSDIDQYRTVSGRYIARYKYGTAKMTRMKADFTKALRAHGASGLRDLLFTSCAPAIGHICEAIDKGEPFAGPEGWYRRAPSILLSRELRDQYQYIAA